MRNNSVSASSRWPRKSRVWCRNCRSKRSLTIKSWEIMLSWWLSLKLRRESYKKRPKLSALRTPDSAIRSERLRNKQRLRRRRWNKSMSAAPRSTLLNSVSRPAPKRRTSQSSRISTRRFRRYTSGRCRTCKISSPRRPRRWRSQRGAGSSN